MKGNHENYKDILEILPNNMNKGIRLDLNTHHITKLATQLARIVTAQSDNSVADGLLKSQDLSTLSLSGRANTLVFG